MSFPTQVLRKPTLFSNEYRLVIVALIGQWTTATPLQWAWIKPLHVRQRTADAMDKVLLILRLTLQQNLNRLF